jgi:hypothetical protein
MKTPPDGRRCQGNTHTYLMDLTLDVSQSAIGSLLATSSSKPVGRGTGVVPCVPRTSTVFTPWQGVGFSTASTRMYGHIQQPRRPGTLVDCTGDWWRPTWPASCRLPPLCGSRVVSPPMVPWVRLLSARRGTHGASLACIPTDKDMVGQVRFSALKRWQACRTGRFAFVCASSVTRNWNTLQS